MKGILLAVCGLAPQVITETLYGLHQMGQQVAAVKVLTTRQGKNACVAGLFGAGDGHYYRYLKEYGIGEGEIDFSPRRIVAVKDRRGFELDDIASPEDSESFLRLCLESAFHLCSRDEVRVFFSIAGGRKTMGACLTVAAQFYARPQDRVYHVLVSPEFESNPEFYYPPRRSRVITLKDRLGQPYLKHSRYAQVTLVPLPIVSVRERISDEFLKVPESPATLMLSALKDRPPEMVVDCRQRRLIWRGRECDMMPARLALYAFFALRKRNAACGRKHCGECSDCYLELSQVLEYQDEIKALYQEIARGRELEQMSTSGILSLSAENFASYKSKIKQELEKAYGGYELPWLEIASQGTRPDTRYGIRLDRFQIKVIL